MTLHPVPYAVGLTMILLAGCASSANGPYPSLAKRPIEERFAVVESTPLALPGPVPADVAGRLDKWRGDAAGAGVAFAAARSEAEVAVSAAGRAPVASEAWIAAQQAVSRLAVTRGPAVVALADVDALYIAQQNADAIDGLPEISALRVELAASIDRQTAVLASLTARLAQ